MEGAAERELRGCRLVEDCALDEQGGADEDSLHAFGCVGELHC